MPTVKTGAARGSCHAGVASETACAASAARAGDTCNAIRGGWADDRGSVWWRKRTSEQPKSQNVNAPRNPCGPSAPMLPVGPRLMVAIVVPAISRSIVALDIIPILRDLLQGKELIKMPKRATRWRVKKSGWAGRCKPVRYDGWPASALLPRAALCYVRGWIGRDVIGRGSGWGKARAGIRG